MLAFICTQLTAMDYQKYKTLNEKSLMKIFLDYQVIKEHRRRSTDNRTSAQATHPQKTESRQLIPPLATPIDNIQHIVAMCTSINDFRNEGGTILISIINAPVSKEFTIDDKVELINFALDRCLHLKPDYEIDESNGYRALHYACEKGYLKIIELLLNRGADKKSRTKDQQTPFDLLRKAPGISPDDEALYLSILEKLE